MLIGSFLNAQIQVGSTTLEEREVVDGLDVPWEIKWGPDSGNGADFLWVTERSGIVSRINVSNGEKPATRSPAKTAGCIFCAAPNTCCN